MRFWLVTLVALLLLVPVLMATAQQQDVAPPTQVFELIHLQHMNVGEASIIFGGSVLSSPFDNPRRGSGMRSSKSTFGGHQNNSGWNQGGRGYGRSSR